MSQPIFHLEAIPTRNLINDTNVRERCTITEFYRSDSGIACAAILFANGEFDEVGLDEITVVNHHNL